MTDVLPLLLCGLRLLPATVAVGVLAGRLWWLGAPWTLSLLPWLAVPGTAQGPLWLMALAELTFGLALALALCGPLLAARHAGRLLELGWGGRWGAQGALSGLFAVSSVALFASLGGLRLWTRTLLEASAGDLAPAATQASLAWVVASLVTQLLRLSLSLAAPAWIAFVLIDTGAAALTRLSGAPGRAIVGLALPLRLGSVVLALPVCLERLPDWLRAAADATLSLTRRFTL